MTVQEDSHLLLIIPSRLVYLSSRKEVAHANRKIARTPFSQTQRDHYGCVDPYIGRFSSTGIGVVVYPIAVWSQAILKRTCASMSFCSQSIRKSINSVDVAREFRVSAG